MNISRRRFNLLGSLSLLFIMSIASVAFLTSQSSAQERKYRVKNFKDMPVVIHEVRNCKRQIIGFVIWKLKLKTSLINQSTSLLWG